MGDFRIVIDCVGGHGQDREKENNEVVDFTNGGHKTPESIAQEFIKELKNSGCSVGKAVVIHWPTDNYPEGRDPEKEIVDDLITGVRKGSFKSYCS